VPIPNSIWELVRRVASMIYAHSMELRTSSRSRGRPGGYAKCGQERARVKNYTSLWTSFMDGQ